MIRSFRQPDAAHCADIVRECVALDGSLAASVRDRILETVTCSGILERSRLFYLAVCEEEGAILGLGGLDLNEIRLLYVAPGHQGRGVGSALLAHLESMVPPALFPDVFVYATLPAVPFYSRWGYRPEGDWEIDIGGESMSTVFMRKPL